MRIRYALILVLACVVMACAGGTEEPAAEPEGEAAPAATTPMDDDAALEQLAQHYVQSFNQHDAGMVADHYTADAVSLTANGSVYDGNAAILASLEQAMASSPMLSIEPAEHVVVGDTAVGRGTYGLTMTPEGGEAVTVAGNYMTAFARQEGEWKATAVITNYNAPPPDAIPPAELPDEAPDELVDSPAAQLTADYVEHYNQGHAAVVAELYDDNASVAFANEPPVEGRAAIQAALEEAMAQGSPQLTVHEVAAMDMGEGWVIGGGWYEVDATTEEGSAHQQGNYLVLCRTADDGSLKIHWMVTNQQVPAAM